MTKFIKGFLGALLIPLSVFAQTSAKPTNVHVSAGLTTVTCTTTLNAGANVLTAITNATAGDTICLNSGSYSAVSPHSITKASTVTIRSTTGVGAVLADLSILDDHKLTFDHLTISSAGLDFAGGTSCDVTISNSVINGGNLVVNKSGNTCSTNVIELNTFTNWTSDGFEGAITVNRNPATGTGGNLTIRNNTFSGGGCADGVHITGGADGVTIGPGNIFQGLLQGGCSVHVDAIQNVDGGHLTVTGNYFKNNTIYLGFYDIGNNVTITNNVFDTPNGAGQHFQMGGIITMTMAHNTFKDCDIAVGTKIANPQNSGWVFKNNLLNNSVFESAGDQPGCGAGCAVSYTLLDGTSSSYLTGTNMISGSPTFTGGASPTTWAGFRLTSGSLGHAAGDDGFDMGSRCFVSGATSCP